MYYADQILIMFNTIQIFMKRNKLSQMAQVLFCGRYTPTKLL